MQLDSLLTVLPIFARMYLENSVLCLSAYSEQVHRTLNMELLQRDHPILKMARRAYLPIFSVSTHSDRCNPRSPAHRGGLVFVFSAADSVYRIQLVK